MSASIREDQTFTKITVADPVLTSRQFEYCKFISCDLSGADFSNTLFIDCVFEDCNLSLANMSGTGLQNIRFKNCKLNGVNFGRSLDFLMEMHFDGCNLDKAVFYKKKNKKAIFKDCSMVEADLTEADLSDCKFDNCNLHRATFDQTILKNTDVSTSYNFIIDPDNNIIKGAKFSVHGLPGLLVKYGIEIRG
ncbi:MAG: pentapeptide repeat-containing protein [Bacteroidetes bacterium]|nr:pentapeptide repeat-containing protein [Bacteroidota bacterium]